MVNTKDSDLSDAEVKLRIIIKIMRYLGIHPKQPRIYLFFSYLHAILCSTFVVSAIYMMATATDINVVMKGTETLLVYFESLTKFLVIFLNMNKLNYLFENLHKFWKSDNKAYYNLWSKLLVVYCSFVYIASVLIFVVKHGLAFDIYVADIKYLYEIISLTQRLQFLFKAPFITMLDSFYFALCCILKEQYTMLMKEFENCKDKERLKVLIEHHSFLLEYSKRLAETYSEALFVQYLMSVGGLCSELYFVDARDEIGDKIFAALLGVGLFFQLVLFCLLTAEISDKAPQIADAVYFSQWYNFPIEDRKMMVFIIARAQEETASKAGGLFFINRSALTQITKNAYSIYTLAKNFSE